MGGRYVYHITVIIVYLLCSPVGVSVIEVVTSQMIAYGLMAMLQVVPAVFVGIYAFDVS